MDENKITEERIPAGIVTMLLAGYRETNKRLTYAIIALAACWLCTVGGFLYYLAGYEVQVSNYGNFENSKVNASAGQLADNMTNYFQQGEVNGKNQK